jgi:SAM-dependent methyltransferase
MRSEDIKWPKVPPTLSPEQLEAREKYMRLWHEQLPTKYRAIENFNHGFPVKLSLKPGSKTLEIGAGLGEHAHYENLRDQDYHFLEFRPEFCEEIRKRFPNSSVSCGNIEERQNYADKMFDRIVAIHVLEHLRHLPNALREIHRILKDDGVFDIVIPCEGGLAHSFGRKISAERLFKREFRMDFTPIRKNEHVSTYQEIRAVLADFFTVERSSFFPSLIPIHHLNFCAGFRLRKLVSS